MDADTPVDANNRAHSRLQNRADAVSHSDHSHHLLLQDLDEHGNWGGRLNRLAFTLTQISVTVDTLHRMRQQLVKFRTAQINCLRGLLAEHGEVMPQGRAGMRRDIASALERVSQRLPGLVVDTLREQWVRVTDLDSEIDRIERRLTVWHRQTLASRRIAAIPGVGVLSATAAVATMGDPTAFRSGREFAAWLGLVPRHTGTGGRVRMLGISKRGDTYLRTLLIHGARSALVHAKLPSAWQLGLVRRRPSNVVVVALANKTARTIWALLAHDRAYEPNFRPSICLAQGRE